MTETYEQKVAKEKARKKRQQENEEAMLIGFMAGKMGGVYRMAAAEAAASGEW
jgi:hypothetical protein